MINLEINLKALIVVLLAARVIYSEAQRPVEDNNIISILYLVVSIVALLWYIGGVLP